MTNEVIKFNVLPRIENLVWIFKNNANNYFMHFVLTIINIHLTLSLSLSFIPLLSVLNYLYKLNKVYMYIRGSESTMLNARRVT